MEDEIPFPRVPQHLRPVGPLVRDPGGRIGDDAGHVANAGDGQFLGGEKIPIRLNEGGPVPRQPPSD